MAKAQSKRPDKRSRPQILTAEHYDAIEAALRRLADLPGVIDSAQLCDIDCQEYRQAHAYFLERLTKLKQHFFPNGRP